MPPSLAEASVARQERLLDAEITGRLELLLANFERVTANPRKMGYLRFLLKHYAKDPHPFTACVKDNMKRFGPGKTEGVCGVLKDLVRQSTRWRGHPERDHGAPGVAIAEADKDAAPAYGGHHMAERRPSLIDELDAEFGVTNHSIAICEAFGALALISEHCDVYRVLLGLDQPPSLALEAIHAAA